MSRHPASSWVAVLVLPLVMGACERAAPKSPHAPPAAFHTVRGPIATFQRACASCHGPYGEMFPRPFTITADDAFRAKVQEMVQQRSGVKATPEQFEAVLAYAQALRDESPFLALTQAGPDALVGEVTPGCTVIAKTESGELACEVDGHEWTLAVAPGSPRVLRIIARSAGGRESVLEPTRQAWSVR